MTPAAWDTAGVVHAMETDRVPAVQAAQGRERGWFTAITLAGLVAITAVAIYSGLRGLLADELNKVRRWEDCLPVIGFVVALALLLRA